MLISAAISSAPDAVEGPGGGGASGDVHEHASGAGGVVHLPGGMSAGAKGSRVREEGGAGGETTKRHLLFSCMKRECRVVLNELCSCVLWCRDARQEKAASAEGRAARGVRVRRCVRRPLDKERDFYIVFCFPCKNTCSTSIKRNSRNSKLDSLILLLIFLGPIITLPGTRDFFFPIKTGKEQMPGEGQLRANGSRVTFICCVFLCFTRCLRFSLLHNGSWTGQY